MIGLRFFQDRLHILYTVNDRRCPASLSNFVDCCRLQLRWFVFADLGLQRDEAAFVAHDDIWDAGCAVLATVLLPEEAFRHCSKILADSLDQCCFIHTHFLLRA